MSPTPCIHMVIIKPPSITIPLPKLRLKLSETDRKSKRWIFSMPHSTILVLFVALCVPYERLPLKLFHPTPYILSWTWASIHVRWCGHAHAQCRHTESQWKQAVTTAANNWKRESKTKLSSKEYIGRQNVFIFWLRNYAIAVNRNRTESR